MKYPVHIVTFSCELICAASGAVLCQLKEWSSAEQALSRACHSDSTHGRLRLAALDQLADCFAAQVVLTLHCHSPFRMLWQKNQKIAARKRLQAAVPPLPQ